MFNPDVIQVEEILSRAVQGRTEPFLCRGEDGQLYFVKGRHASRKSQIAEWVGSCLAMEFGLPVAPCAIVEIDERLIDIAPPEFKELGSGFAFGSLMAKEVLEMTWSNVDDVPTDLQRDLLMFDWWVKNGDRVLTPLGGNPNLLWNVGQKRIVVIDHNLCFESDFSAEDFLETHIFRSHWNDISQDWIVRVEYEDRFRSCASCIDEIWDKMPDEWLWLGDGVPVPFQKDMVVDTLGRFENFNLWEVAR